MLIAKNTTHQTPLLLSLLTALSCVLFACSEPAPPVPAQPASEQTETASQADPMPEKIITDFTPADAEASQWRNVDDTVMGGISRGEMLITAQGTGLFQGQLSLENNGGFSSVRRDVLEGDFANATRVSVRVKGDGRRYQLRLHPRDGSRVTYRAAFDTVSGEWQTLPFALTDFEPVFRGRIIDSAPPLDADNISQVGFLIADKESGNFKLEVDWIAAE